MGEHDCVKEGEFGRLESKVERIEKELFNGNGLAKTVPVLANEVQHLAETNKDLRIAVSGLNKFVNEIQGSQNTFKRAAPWVSISIAIIAVAITIIAKIDSNKERNKIEMQLQWKQDRTQDPATRGLTPEQLKAIGGKETTLKDSKK